MRSISNPPHWKVKKSCTYAKAPQRIVIAARGSKLVWPFHRTLIRHKIIQRAASTFVGPHLECVEFHEANILNSSACAGLLVFL